MYVFFFKLNLKTAFTPTIILQSNEITSACYEIDWHNLKLTNQRMLVIIMERAKRPLALQAMDVFSLDLFTLMTVSPPRHIN